MNKRELRFYINGCACVDLENVKFFDSDLNTVDVSNLTTDQIMEKLYDYEIDWDWSQLVKEKQFHVEIEDVDIIDVA